MNTLTTINNNGIINHMQVVQDVDDLQNQTQIQLVWNGIIQCVVIGMNSGPVDYGAHANHWEIKNFRAIYFNGILIVKNGKVWPRKNLKTRIFSFLGWER